MEARRTPVRLCCRTLVYNGVVSGQAGSRAPLEANAAAERHWDEAHSLRWRPPQPIRGVRGHDEAYSWCLVNQSPGGPLSYRPQFRFSKLPATLGSKRGGQGWDAPEFTPKQTPPTHANPRGLMIPPIGTTSTQFGARPASSNAHWPGLDRNLLCPQPWFLGFACPAQLLRSAGPKPGTQRVTD